MSTPEPTKPPTTDDGTVALAQAMMDAARAGNQEGLVPILDQGAPLEMRDGAGNTMLMLAAYHGHAELVAELARRGADVDAANDRGQSPLAGVVFKDDLASARALIAAGADPDAGTPSARETAVYFEKPQFTALFEEQPEA